MPRFIPAFSICAARARAPLAASCPLLLWARHAAADGDEARQKEGDGTARNRESATACFEPRLRNLSAPHTLRCAGLSAREASPGGAKWPSVCAARSRRSPHRRERYAGSGSGRQTDRMAHCATRPGSRSASSPAAGLADVSLELRPGEATRIAIEPDADWQTVISPRVAVGGEAPATAGGAAPDSPPRPRCDACDHCADVCSGAPRDVPADALRVCDAHTPISRCSANTRAHASPRRRGVPAVLEQARRLSTNRRGREQAAVHAVPGAQTLYRGVVLARRARQGLRRHGDGQATPGWPALDPATRRHGLHRGL